MFSEDNEYFLEHPTPSNAFVRACADGDMDAVRRMISEGTDLDQRDPGFEEVVTDSEGKNRTYRMRDMREPNTLGATGMEMAMQTRNLELVKLLYAAGANALSCEDAERYGEHNAITTGISHGFVEGVRFLVDDCGLPLRTADDKGDGWMLVRAMHEEGTFAMLRYLVEEKGVDIHAKTENGLSAAHMACDFRAPPELLEYCYEKNAVPESTQHIGKKLSISFHPEAKKDMEKVTGSSFDILEDASALIDRFGSNSTFLNKSVFWSDIEKVRIHLKHGANPFQTDDQGVDAFGVLKFLRENDPRSLFAFTPEHAQIERMLKDELNPRPAPGKKPGPKTP